MKHVALMGLGVMGSGMGERLLKAKFPLVVYNRTPERTLTLAQAGAQVASSPCDAAAQADIILSMVTDDAASRKIWLGQSGALAGSKPGSILIECSTLSPSWIEELAAAAAQHGCTLLDVPVTGSKVQVEAGELLFLAGGEKEAVEMARPVLMAMGRDVVYLGPSGSGARMKLINNLFAGVQIAVLAEILALIERAGMDREVVLGVLFGGALGSPIVKTISTRMLNKDYNVNFSLKLMEKDLRYALAEGGCNNLSLKTVAAARELFHSAVEKGFGDRDFSAVVEPIRASNSNVQANA